MITFDTGSKTELKDSPGDLVTELLAGDDGDLLAHPLVCVEVAAQPGVVFLDDDPSGLLHRLGPDSSLLRGAYHGVKHIYMVLLQTFVDFSNMTAYPSFCVEKWRRL